MKKKALITKHPKKPWPTKEAMEQVYAHKLWGDNASQFYSGEGSHEAHLVQPYLEVLISFLTTFKNPLVVCDLGCGDFNIGKELVGYTSKYIAVDIVPDLIAHNKARYQADHLEFHCLNMAVDALPMGDCAIVRQVLQHLSNTEIQQILHALARFKYVVITEHLPSGDFIPNIDIISGQGIRLKKQSGVDVLAAPFLFKAKVVTSMLAIPLRNGKGVISTTLYSLF
jgi:hypothetical protein